MELYKKKARDRLVIMVTHNAELADAYAMRIAKLGEGKITDDLNPIKVDESKREPAVQKKWAKRPSRFLPHFLSP